MTSVVWVGVASVTAVAVHLGIVFGIPYVMTFAARLKLRASSPNVLQHHDLVTAENQSVVKPCPDLLYSGCYYDLSRGPLLFEAEIPRSYYSLALYARNTTNFFTINDVDIGTSYTSLLIKTADMPHVESPEVHVVTSPSTVGFLIVRALVTNPSEAAQMSSLQRRAKCRSLELVPETLAVDTSWRK